MAWHMAIPTMTVAVSVIITTPSVIITTSRVKLVDLSLFGNYQYLSNKM